MIRWPQLIQWAAAGAAALVLAAAPAWAAEEDSPSLRETLGLDYSVRGSYWSSDRQLNDDKGAGAGTVWLRLSPLLSETISLKVEGWVTQQPATDKEKDIDPSPAGELREAYVAYLGEKLEVRLGRQIVVWGRADRLNPTDNLTTRDFRLLFPEDDDLRRGSGMLEVGYPILGATVRAYWIPEFRPNVFPTPALPSSIVFTDDEVVNDSAQGAIRIDHSGSAFDWSLSYFDGRDRNPDIVVDDIKFTGMVPTKFILQRRYNRVKVVGADAATTLGRFGLRAEMARTQTEDEDGKDAEIKNSFFYGVLGADRTFFEYLNVNVQYIYRETENWQDPYKAPASGRSLAIQNAIFSQQLHRVENGASMRISYQWLNETLTTELAAVQYFQQGDQVVAPKITYKATDALRITAGGQYFSGPDESLFGAQKDNSTTYLEVRWGY